VRGADIGLLELLSFEPQGGIIRFAGERAVILDAVALGLLRKELIDTLGARVARGILTRFGFAHGWRTAAALKDGFPWDSERAWRVAGGRLHTLQGMMIFEPVEDVSVSPQGGEVSAEGVWRSSYEAEQHRLHLGAADEPTCWTLCGFASGYLSYVNQKEIYCLEVACEGCGAPHCRMLGKTREAWGDEINPHLPYYRAEELDASLQRLMTELKRCEDELARKRASLDPPQPAALDLGELVVQSEPMVRVVERAKRVARFDTTVLITGESGTGKELLAKRIHDWSARAAGPFIAVNCGALTETLLESELFGHARGAFTGAARDHKGLFEAAHGGTLFLDEVGEVSTGMQVKLLRALQEREVRRVGETAARSFDARVIAATNRELAREVEAGSFRQDLYFRLKVMELQLPPLRQRREDVLPIARAMISQAAKRLRRAPVCFSAAAADQLLRYRWPGNVRELGNAIEHALILAEGERIEPHDLPEEVREAPAPAAPIPEGLPLDALERLAISAALARHQGNRALAARELEIGEATLYRRLKQYRAQGLWAGDL
jgi:two-component system, NtrC family, response regulator HydG